MEGSIIIIMKDGSQHVLHITRDISMRYATLQLIARDWINTQHIQSITFQPKPTIIPLSSLGL